MVLECLGHQKNMLWFEEGGAHCARLAVSFTAGQPGLGSCEGLATISGCQSNVHVQVACLLRVNGDTGSPARGFQGWCMALGHQQSTVFSFGGGSRGGDSMPASDVSGSSNTYKRVFGCAYSAGRLLPALHAQLNTRL